MSDEKIFAMSELHGSNIFVVNFIFVPQKMAVWIGEMVPAVTCTAMYIHKTIIEFVL